eukprot:EG_transcript_11555
MAAVVLPLEALFQPPAAPPSWEDPAEHYAARFAPLFGTCALPGSSPVPLAATVRGFLARLPGLGVWFVVRVRRCLRAHRCRAHFCRRALLWRRRRLEDARQRWETHDAFWSQARLLADDGAAAGPADAAEERAARRRTIAALHRHQAHALALEARRAVRTAVAREAEMRALSRQVAQAWLQDEAEVDGATAPGPGLGAKLARLHYLRQACRTDAGKHDPQLCWEELQLGDLEEEHHALGGAFPPPRQPALLVPAAPPSLENAEPLPASDSPTHAGPGRMSPRAAGSPRGLLRARQFAFGGALVEVGAPRPTPSTALPGETPARPASPPSPSWSATAALKRVSCPEAAGGRRAASRPSSPVALLSLACRATSPVSLDALVVAPYGTASAPLSSPALRSRAYPIQPGRLRPAPQRPGSPSWLGRGASGPPRAASPTASSKQKARGAVRLPSRAGESRGEGGWWL